MPMVINCFGARGPEALTAHSWASAGAAAPALAAGAPVRVGGRAPAQECRAVGPRAAPAVHREVGRALGQSAN